MTTIGRIYHFESAHRLPLLPETHKCHHLHGHNYKFIVTVRSELDDRGFVVDFAELDDIVQPLVKKIDHKVLNEIEGLENPTVELIAQWFLGRVTIAQSVRVYENDECYAEVTR